MFVQHGEWGRRTQAHSGRQRQANCLADEGARATLCLEFAREYGYGSLIGDFACFCGGER